MNNGGRIICRGCGAENDEGQDECVECRRPLYAERIEKYMPSKSVRKEFNLSTFVQRNFHLFSLIGIFGALSFYLTNLIPKSADNVFYLSGNWTFLLNESINESPNSSIVVNKLINGSLLGAGGIHPNETVNASDFFFFINPGEGLQIGVVTCYCFFFIFIIAILNELSKYEECYSTWILNSLFIILILIIVSYLISTYSLIISALSIVAIAMGTMIVYRVSCVQIFANELTSLEEKKKKLGFLLSSAIILAVVAIVVQNLSHIIWVFGIALMWGIAGGLLQVFAVIITEGGGISQTLRYLFRR